jgi:hypothetical protein
MLYLDRESYHLSSLELNKKLKMQITQIDKNLPVIFSKKLKLDQIF